jgi:hypothetical protein
MRDQRQCVHDIVAHGRAAALRQKRQRLAADEGIAPP